MKQLKYKYVAIDFDGTIAEEKFPDIGEPLPNVREVLTELVNNGAQIAIWTCRGGSDKFKVIQWLRDNKIPWHYFNRGFPELMATFGGQESPKIFAQIYIDDRSIHCEKIDWLEIREKLYV